MLVLERDEGASPPYAIHEGDPARHLSTLELVTPCAFKALDGA
jgi:hypothetical protein